MKLKDLEDILKQTFEETLVTTFDTVYELSDDEKFYKLVISIHGIDSEDSIIIHTKFIFKVNLDKTETIEDSFIYLYDLNCIYKRIEWANPQILADKIIDIISSNKFGKDIRAISNFLSNPLTELNEELARQKIENFSFYEVKYNPKYKIMPCKWINFDFDINVNNIFTFKVNISKKGKEDYKFVTTLDKWVEDSEIESLNNISDIIVSQIINIMKKIV